MNPAGQFDMKLDFWNRRILNFFWWMLGVSVMAEVVALVAQILIEPEKLGEYIVRKMLLPSGCQALVILACEWYVKIRKSESTASAYLLLITCSIIAAIMIVSNPRIQGLQLLLLIPMGVSVIFLHMRLLSFSLLTNLVFQLGIYFLFPAIKNNTTVFEICAYMSSLVAGYFVYKAVIQRGHEVLDYLRKANESEQELIIRSTIMDKLSKTDALTGLYNHRTFQDYMDRLIEQSETYHFPLQLAMVDIDNFKKINDTYGHSVGDIILKRVAECLTSSVTSNDIVARYGGEEFAIIFTGVPIEETYRMVEAMREAIASMNHPELNDSTVSVSIGLKNYDQGRTKSAWFEKADALLYEAKRSGKNRTCM